MPRSVEIDHYSQMLASLTVTAARARTTEALVEVHAELASAFSEIFTLLSHDAERAGGDLVADLLARAAADRAAGHRVRA